MFYVEARCDEGWVSEQVDNAVAVLCQRLGMDTTNNGPNFSRNVLTNDEGDVVVMWFEINVAARDEAEALAAELAGLGLEIGIADSDDDESVVDERELERNIAWLGHVLRKRKH